MFMCLFLWENIFLQVSVMKNFKILQRFQINSRKSTNTLVPWFLLLPRSVFRLMWLLHANDNVGTTNQQNWCEKLISFLSLVFGPTSFPGDKRRPKRFGWTIWRAFWRPFQTTAGMVKALPTQRATFLNSAFAAHLQVNWIPRHWITQN
jgi:hypothetical protein